MAYVIYDVDTTRLYAVKGRGTGCDKESWKTKAAARAAMTRGDLDPFQYAIAESSEFSENIEKWVERTNFMTGKKYMERINTPHYCSPSSETYWSM